jgi:NADPH:quinone reductase-like Zn-dependent oxidoreductase
MKAIVYSAYGGPDVLHLEEVDKPVPKANEVLIKVYATSVTTGDVRLRKADPFLTRLFFGFFKPKINILGVDIAGKVEAVGKNVTLFKPGDAVFGSTFDNGLGGYAEYKCMPERSVLDIKPANLSFEKAASVFFGGHTALHFLRKGNISEGKTVLIFGASGALGTYAIQLAKYFRAHVTGVCSTTNIDLVRSLGADEVIDYTKEDFTENGRQYDIIFDTVGKSKFWDCIRSLTSKGSYLRSVHLSFAPILSGLLVGLFSKKKVVGGSAQEHKEDLLFLKDLVINNAISPIIDKVYSMDEIPQAHAYIEKGHKRGNIAITVYDESKNV